MGSTCARKTTSQQSHRPLSRGGRRRASESPATARPASKTLRRNEGAPTPSAAKSTPKVAPDGRPTTIQGRYENRHSKLGTDSSLQSPLARHPASPKGMTPRGTQGVRACSTQSPGLASGGLSDARLTGKRRGLLQRGNESERATDPECERRLI